MKEPYVVYLGANVLSTHETFADALEHYMLSHFLSGAHGDVTIRNTERSDVDDNGLTDDERAQLETV